MVGEKMPEIVDFRNIDGNDTIKDPYKSEASQPKRYCSQQCEDEDKADKK